MINRSTPKASPSVALTKTEIGLLDQLINDKRKTSPHGKRLGTYLIKIARLGGYLARKNDPPPGNVVMWRGLPSLAIPLSASRTPSRSGGSARSQVDPASALMTTAVIASNAKCSKRSLRIDVQDITY